MGIKNYCQIIAARFFLFPLTNAPTPSPTDAQTPTPTNAPTPTPTNASTPIPTVTSSSSPSQSSSPTSTPTRLPPPGLNCDAASDRAEIMSIFISQVTDVIQEEALQWITNRDEMQMLPCDFKSIQRYTMAELYFSMNGSGWDKQKKWLSESSVCEWEKVICNDDGDVILLDLGASILLLTFINFQVLTSMLLADDNNMSGSIPSSISTLSSLESINFSRNRLTGTLPITP